MTGASGRPIGVGAAPLTLADLRAIAEEKYWDNSLRASEQVLDLSVFRLVTNFVRLWRREKGR